jgi:uncharacterized damage-inducible protein DinB
MASHDIAAGMLAEFEQELKTTRRFIERVPEDKLTWRPHEKSMTAGELALHVAESPEGVLRLCEPDVAEAPNFSGGRPQPRSLHEALDALERGASYVREKLPTISDARMQEMFHVVQGGKPLMSLPRVAFLRSILLNHWYHHRGQLGVYLRLMGASVPSSYGPSGDEMPNFKSDNTL